MPFARPRRALRSVPHGHVARGGREESESEPECLGPRTSRCPRARRAQVVEKCLDAGLVPFVIKLLTRGSLEGTAEGPAVKGHGVRLLKKMAADLRCGATVQATRGRPLRGEVALVLLLTRAVVAAQALLDEESAWEQFKQQEHDLFLATTTASPAAGAGTGAGGRVGLLTQ